MAIKVAGPKKQLLLSFTNRIRVDFAFTWVAHIRALGLTNFLVGATDDVAVEELTTGKVPCFSMKTNLPQGEWPWGSSSFKVGSRSIAGTGGGLATVTATHPSVTKTDTRSMQRTRRSALSLR